MKRRTTTSRLAGAALFALCAVAPLACGGQTVVVAGGDGKGAGANGQNGQPERPGFNEQGVPLVTTASKVDVLLAIDDSRGMGVKQEVLARSVRPFLRNLAEKTRDVHVALITSTLANGGDVCNTKDNAHLKGVGATPVGLAYDGQGDLEGFLDAAEGAVRSIGESGCGFEALLESVHQFLSEPAPWSGISIDSNQAAHDDGVDAILLTQRQAFLRPDSLVVVLALTDEDDASVDPLSVGGQGWYFVNEEFAGSMNVRSDGMSTTAPRAASVCPTNPLSNDCQSCAFAARCLPNQDAWCAALRADPECVKLGGYYAGNEDPMNLRFYRMKERFGVEPTFPVDRYVRSLTDARMPDQRGKSCRNPLFAATLPYRPGDDLCTIDQSTRSPELVVFGLLTGVVDSLVASDTPDWVRALGASPDTYDEGGIDPHMKPSIAPRAGLPQPGDAATDPVHGREWTTNGQDLQLACRFALETPRTCAASDPSCPCASPTDSPLCDGNVQTHAGAVPGVRHLRVAKALGDRAVVGSICPPSVGEGYAGMLARLSARIAPKLVP